MYLVFAFPFLLTGNDWYRLAMASALLGCLIFPSHQYAERGLDVALLSQ